MHTHRYICTHIDIYATCLSEILPAIPVYHSLICIMAYSYIYIRTHAPIDIHATCLPNILTAIRVCDSFMCIMAHSHIYILTHVPYIYVQPVCQRGTVSDSIVWLIHVLIHVHHGSFTYIYSDACTIQIRATCLSERYCQRFECTTHPCAPWLIHIYIFWRMYYKYTCNLFVREVLPAIRVYDPSMCIMAYSYIYSDACTTTISLRATCLSEVLRTIRVMPSLRAWWCKLVISRRPSPRPRNLASTTTDST